MKKLITLLAGITLTAAPILQSSQFISSYAYTDDIVEPELIKSIDDMNKLINNSKNIEEFIKVYQDIPNVIFYAKTIESLDKYMSKVFEFKNCMDKLEQTTEQNRQIYSIQQEIQRKYSEWVDNNDVPDMISEYNLVFNRTKKMSKKMYYSFNESSATLMVQDMDKYQGMRLEQSTLQAELTNLTKEISLNKSMISQYDRMIKWQNNLKQIYENWINEAKRLKNNFDVAYNKLTIGNIAGKLADFFVARQKEYLNKVIEHYFEKDEESDVLDIESDVVDYLKVRDVNSDRKPADWINNDPIVSENMYYSDNDNDNDNVYTNAELVKLTVKEIDKDMQKDKNDDEKEKRKKLISEIKEKCEEVYQLDDCIFGQLHDSAIAFTDFVNDGIGRLSSDLKVNFEANGIHVPTAFDDACKKALDIGKAILKSATSAFGLDNLSNLSSIVFGTIDEINKWLKTFDVMFDAQKSIDIIKSTEDEVTKLPDDCNINPKEVQKQIDDDTNQLDSDSIKLKQIEEDLKKSRFDELDKASKDWEDNFLNYKDFLDIPSNLNKLSMTKNDRHFSLDILKYFNENYYQYESIIARETMLYNKIIVSGKAKEYLKNEYEAFIENHKKLSELKVIIEKGYGEIN